MAAKKKKQGKTPKRKSVAKKAARSKRPTKRQTAAPVEKAEAPAAEEGFVILFDDPSEPVGDASIENEASVIRLRRDCTIEEITGIRQRMLTALDKESNLTVDLGAVKDVDTAFLQLLNAFRLEAEARQVQVSLRNQTELFLQSASMLGLTEQLTEG